MDAPNLMRFSQNGSDPFDIEDRESKVKVKVTSFHFSSYFYFNFAPANISFFQINVKFTM